MKIETKQRKEMVEVVTKVEKVVGTDYVLTLNETDAIALLTACHFIGGISKYADSFRRLSDLLWEVGISPVTDVVSKVDNEHRIIFVK